MYVSAENDEHRNLRVARKSDGKVVNHVTEADTDKGTYRRMVLGEDGRPTLSRIARVVVHASGERHSYDADEVEVGDEPEFLLEDVAEPFQLVDCGTGRVIAETAE
jgi:hypothetical protein